MNLKVVTLHKVKVIGSLWLNPLDMDLVAVKGSV